MRTYNEWVSHLRICLGKHSDFNLYNALLDVRKGPAGWCSQHLITRTNPSPLQHEKSAHACSIPLSSSAKTWGRSSRRLQTVQRITLQLFRQRATGRSELETIRLKSAPPPAQPLRMRLKGPSWLYQMNENMPSRILPSSIPAKYFLANVRFDPAENEPAKKLQKCYFC